jgi:hypothetical protein
MEVDGLAAELPLRLLVGQIQDGNLWKIRPRRQVARLPSRRQHPPPAQPEERNKSEPSICESQGTPGWPAPPKLCKEWLGLLLMLR